MSKFGNSHPYILITGSTGYVCNYLADKLLGSTNFNIVLTYRHIKGDYAKNTQLFFEKVDLLEPQLFDNIFIKYKPTYVIHLAAMARVSDGEKTPVEVIKANLVATVILAKLSIKYDVKSMIFTSSNLAQDAVSVVGIGKLLVEQYFQKIDSHATNLICLRMPNVIDSNGAVTLIFKKLIENNKLVTITHPDMSRLFVTGEKAADLLYYLMHEGVNKSIYVSYEKPIKIMDLAKSMIKESGKDIGIKCIGIKPGEKLTEKYFREDEIVATNYPDLGIIDRYCYDLDLIILSLNKLNKKDGVLNNKSIHRIFNELKS
jgi:UDP-N-acetyl-D-glucosamine 4,6-dehydratase